MLINTIIGYPVKHSISPEIHNYSYLLDNKADQFKFEMLEVKPEDLEKFFDDFRKDNIQNSLTITIPHKINSIKFVDEIESNAKKIGAINTVIKKDDRLIGYNTDYLGTSIPLFNQFQKDNHKIKFEEKFLRGYNVLLLGAGGASRAMAFAVLDKGANLIIWNRTFEKTQKLVEDLKKIFNKSDIKEVNKIQNIDFKEVQIIINSTSAGLSPNSDITPIDSQFINSSHIVFDAIYKPEETRFLKESKNKGATIIKGGEMFLYQAIKQIEIQTKINPNVDLLRQKIYKLLNTR